MWRSSLLVWFMDLLCRVRNNMVYLLSLRTVYILTRVLFWCLFHTLLGNWENKQENNPLMGHSSSYIILHLYVRPLQWWHNGRDGVTNYQPHHCLLNQMASNAVKVSIWWRHHITIDVTHYAFIYFCLLPQLFAPIWNNTYFLHCGDASRWNPQYGGVHLHFVRWGSRKNLGTICLDAV